MLICLLHSCSCPLSIFTAFLLIPFSTPKRFVIHLPFCSYPSLVWNLCFTMSPAIGLISVLARSYTTWFPPQVKYILSVFYYPSPSCFMLPWKPSPINQPVSVYAMYSALSSSHCKCCSHCSQEVTFWGFLHTALSFSSVYPLCRHKERQREKDSQWYCRINV